MGERGRPSRLSRSTGTPHSYMHDVLARVHIRVQEAESSAAKPASTNDDDEIWTWPLGDTRLFGKMVPPKKMVV